MELRRVFFCRVLRFHRFVLRRSYFVYPQIGSFSCWLMHLCFVLFVLLAFLFSHVLYVYIYICMSLSVFICIYVYSAAYILIYI